MSDKQPEYIICGKVGHSRVVPGADITECCECHHPIWISPASKQIQQEITLKTICMDCAEPLMKDVKPDDICPVNNGQLLEIARYFNISAEEAAKRLQDVMKYLPQLLELRKNADLADER